MVGTKVISLGKKELSQSVVRIPCLEEQQQIATLFTVLDRRIDLANKKLATLQIIKQGMLEKIFSQELRFKDDEGHEFPAWVRQPLGNIFTQVNETTELTDDMTLFSLRVEDGWTAKTERYDRSFLTKKEDIYKIVKPSWFVYNPMNMTLGAIGYNDTDKSVAVSGYYTTMVTKGDNDAQYFLAWMKTKQALHLFHKYATGTLIEKQRVQFPTLAKIKTDIPCPAEQQKIAAYFTALDRAITAAQQKAAALRTIKRGLLQKMFV